MGFAAGVSPVRAAEGAAGHLGRLSAFFRSLGSYRVVFEVRSAEASFPGYYSVGDGRYYISLGAAEVYGADDTRYEVDNDRREVVIDRVDASSRNLLNNPAHAFDFMEEEFRAESLSDTAGVVTLRLTPRRSGGGIGAIDVSVDRATGRPYRVEYLFEGEKIGIDIRSVTAESAAPARFDRSKYAGYETIDFR